MALGKDRAVLKPLRTLFNVGAIGDLPTDSCWSDLPPAAVRLPS